MQDLDVKSILIELQVLEQYFAEGIRSVSALRKRLETLEKPAKDKDGGLTIEQRAKIIADRNKRFLKRMGNIKK